ncbi:Uncharacterized protein GBIM_08568 [Gryllus bimaculatus]|nr:Uncharacterized protein GBIM_08568 [Gryllus bimaculatus]
MTSHNAKALCVIIRSEMDKNSCNESEQSEYMYGGHQIETTKISVVLPSTSSVPDSLTSLLDVDSDYYKIQKVNISEFVNKEFIESFVKEGHLTVLSDSSRIDLEDCMCITPNGQLVLNLVRETYLELGLEGTSSAVSSGTAPRHIIEVCTVATGASKLQTLQLELQTSHSKKFLAWGSCKSLVLECVK